MKEKPGRITLTEAQAIPNRWERAVGVDPSWQARSERMVEEIEEWSEALALLQGDDSDENKKALAMEFIDLMIVGMGYMTAIGANVEQMFIDKMVVNWQKYDPEVIERLRQQGLSTEESLAQAKQLWNNDNGKTAT